MNADVIAIGVRGPLGLSALQVTMCVRARKLEPRSTSFVDRRGQEIGMALTGGLGERCYGFARMARLAAPALAEATHRLPESHAATAETPLPVIVCLPEPGRVDDEPQAASNFIESLASNSGVHIDKTRSSVVRSAQAGFGVALVQAQALLDAGAHAVCVGGVDSYYHPELLKQLDEDYRLHALGADDGFIPSEAAAFVVLARVAKSAPRFGAIMDVEVGVESTAESEDEPNIAATMTRIVADVQQRIGRDFEWAISDFNGERHREREWSMVRSRTMREGVLHTKWVWDTGDVGAASGPLFCALFMQFQALGGAYKPLALLALHSEAGERAAVAMAGAGHE